MTPKTTDPVEKMRARWADAGLQMEVSQRGSRGRGCHPGSGSCCEGAEAPPRPPWRRWGGPWGGSSFDALPDRKVPGMPTSPPTSLDSVSFDGARFDIARILSLKHNKSYFQVLQKYSKRIETGHCYLRGKRAKQREARPSFFLLAFVWLQMGSLSIYFSKTPVPEFTACGMA